MAQHLAESSSRHRQTRWRSSERITSRFKRLAGERRGATDGRLVHTRSAAEAVVEGKMMAPASGVANGSVAGPSGRISKTQDQREARAEHPSARVKLKDLAIFSLSSRR